MGNTRDTGFLQNVIEHDNLGKIGVGGAVHTDFIANLTGNLRVTGTSQLLGAVTSPTFIGALTGIASGNALVSQIPINNNQLTNGAGYLIAAALTPYALLSGANFSGAIGGTTASFSGTVTANTTLTLLNTTSSTTGVIYKGADRFIHNNGIQSTAIGVESGNFTMTGASNTSVGFTALRDISSGADNTAIGTQALRQNTTGASNTAVGLTALVNNLGGSSNTAIGRGALVLNTSGGANTALGVEALFNATTGENNTSIGRSSGGGITTGSRNTILGANVMGLAAALTNNIILASGDGVIKARHDGTNWTLTGTVTAPTFVGALTGVASGNEVPLTFGTGLTRTVNAITNTGVTLITGTANQVIASSSTGSVTLSLPQNIATTSSPTFGGGTIQSAAGSSNLRISDSGGNSVFDIQANAGTGDVNLIQRSNYGLTFATNNITRVSISPTGTTTLAGLLTGTSANFSGSVSAERLNLSGGGAGIRVYTSPSLTTFIDVPVDNASFGNGWQMLVLAASALEASAGFRSYFTYSIAGRGTTFNTNILSSNVFGTASRTNLIISVPSNGVVRFSLQDPEVCFVKLTVISQSSF